MSATNRFNHYMDTHFRGCVLLHRTLDPHRGRELNFYQIPGEWDLVGLSDGTDCFIVPTTTADPTSAKLKKILEDVRNGKQPEVSAPLRRRAAPTPATPDQPANGGALARRLISQPTASPALQRRPVRA